tara:strand:- start:131 stop:781 length:651 start_codon:yes stop_codon:yes gene_type:complete
MIDHDKKYIFIHIPKNAGKSVRHGLGWNGVPRPKHHTIASYTEGTIHKGRQIFNHRANEGVILDDYLKFAVIRNPWSRAVSWYYYHNKSGMQNVYGLNPKTPNGFRDWVKKGMPHHWRENYLREKGWNESCSPLIQSNFIMHDGVIKMDYIISFENLQRDFNTVCKKIKIPQQQLSWSGRGKIHNTYTELYDSETEKIVAEICAKDIEYFGYQFGK